MADLLASLVTSVIAQFSAPLFNGIGTSCYLEEEMKKLQSTFSNATATLQDEEEEQDKKKRAIDLLEKLKLVVYDVEDLLDESATEEFRRKKESDGPMMDKVWTFFSCSNPLLFSVRLGWCIKDINEKLKQIELEKSQFNFRMLDTSLLPKPGKREQIPFLLSAGNVEGRDQDKENVVCSLLRPSDGNSEKVLIVHIVGIAGVGKTTLAKMVFDDERITKNFDLKMWVSVGQNFDEKEITRKMAESATGKFGYFNDSHLEVWLKDTLAVMKFILVLDDVWNDDRAKWDPLERWLKYYGAKGSRILVTTRSQKVVSIMSGTSCDLKSLSNEVSWSLFKKCAFKEEGRTYARLEEVGREISAKCGGNPLMVRNLGCLLYSITEEKEWKDVRDSNLWNLKHKNDDFLPSLKLSYDQLPTELKQCFAYCSMYQKDDEMCKETLVQLWMAQGYIRSTGSTMKLEDIGNKYFRELLLRFFFEEKDEGLGSEKKYKMHNLMHGLANNVSKIESITVETNNQNVLDSEKVLHVSLRNTDLEPNQEFLLQMKKVRTLLFPAGLKTTSMPLVDALLLRYQYLRAVDLSYSEMKKLPRSIGTLKLLRYLNLSGNQWIEKLSNSVCLLQNLQTLKLQGCRELKKLPKDMWKMIKLRHLEITSKMEFLPEEHFTALTSLQSLAILSCDRLTGETENNQLVTQQRPCIPALRRLHIADCPGLVALPRILQNLTTLESVEICDCQCINLKEEISALDQLQSFSIINLPKLVMLPTSLQRSAATLEHLYLSEIPLLVVLPEWVGDFRSLRRFDLSNCNKLMSLPESMRRLTSLQVLNVDSCECLIRRCQKAKGEDWPKISHVQEIYLDKIKIQSL